MTDYGVHVYSQAGVDRVPMVANAQLPQTVDASLVHDGTGGCPGIKTPDGRWDRRLMPAESLRSIVKYWRAGQGYLMTPEPHRKKLGSLDPTHARILAALEVLGNIEERLSRSRVSLDFGIP